MNSSSKHEHKVASRLIQLVRPEAERRKVVDVRIGLSYTAVVLDDGAAGVALTFLDRAEHCCQARPDQAPLVGRTACDLIEKLLSESAIEAAVGLACINAICNRPDDTHAGGDIMHQLHLSAEDRVGMVGNFQPIVRRIQPSGATLHIFERVESQQGNLLPAEEALRILPDCSVALITATTLINHSLDRLLEAAQSCREVIILGASSPLCPAAFEDSGVNMISGVLLPKPKPVLEIVSEGGGMHVFKRHVDKVNIRLKGEEKES